VRLADIEKNRDRVKRFLRAAHKGMEYAATYREAAIDIVVSYNKGADRASIAATYDETFLGRTKDGTITAALQRQEADMRAELVKQPKDKIPPLDRIYDFSMAREAWQELQQQVWKPAL
jgi:ABC-type nitrate/sulfonate/bicarbonate transport system substrate-binding protein